MAHKVFICHSSKDKAVADAACAALESHRIPCWIAPRDISPSAEYGAAIIDALDECQIVLLIFSTHSNDSTQCRREIERAVSKEKILVPFRIEDVLPTRAMEFHLMNIHWLDALAPPREQRLTELCNIIAHLPDRQSPQQHIWRTSEDSVRVSQHRAHNAADAEEPGKNSGTQVGKRITFSWQIFSGGAGICLLLLFAFFMTSTRHAPGGNASFKPTSDQASTPATDEPTVITTTPSPDPRTASVIVAESPVPGRSGTSTPTEKPQRTIKTSNQPTANISSSNTTSTIDSLNGMCDANDGEACKRLGSMYLYHVGVPEDDDKATALYAKACNLGNALGCDLAGEEVLGDIPPKDYVQARTFFIRGCILKSSDACENLGLIYRKGLGVTADMDQAREFYKKSCHLGSSDSCDTARNIH